MSSKINSSYYVNIKTLGIPVLHLMYLTYFILVRRPFNVSYNQPDVHGLRGTRNFYINTYDNMTLGVW